MPLSAPVAIPYTYDMATDEEDVEVPFGLEESGYSRVRNGISVYVYRIKLRRTKTGISRGEEIESLPVKLPGMPESHVIPLI